MYGGQMLALESGLASDQKLGMGKVGSGLAEVGVGLAFIS